MKIIARGYATKRECSVQEPVNLAMPKLWLHEIFLGYFWTVTCQRVLQDF